MPMDYSKLFARMKSRGLTTYRIRKDRILSQSTLQKLREGQSVTTDAIASLCAALDCQPGDLMTYEKAPGAAAGNALRLRPAKKAPEPQAARRPSETARRRSGGRVLEVPILGSIAAGVPITAVEDLDGFVEYLPRGGQRGEELFALRVRGDSMIDAGICSGDIVIVEQTPYADNGEIVAAMIGEEATVKRFYKEKGHYRLQPENPTMDPIIVPEVQILGKVVSSMRYY